jgi:branched-chain amino acid transport system ATP-binding protein
MSFPIVLPFYAGIIGQERKFDVPLLEVQNISHSFGGLQAVLNFTLSLEQGELHGLIGPNGAGKTTVFNLISGFYKPLRGKIFFLGNPISGFKPHEITALGVGRTFQNIRMWNSMTVLENLCISQHYRLGYGLADVLLSTRHYRENEKKIVSSAMEILDILDLTAYAEECPKNLPYGMQRRVEIGRALAVKPKLLLLDEPAAGMHAADVDKLIDLIRFIRTKFHLTICLIEHQMKVVMSVCESLAVMDFGEVIATGSPSEIRNNPHVVKAYLGNEGGLLASN